MGVRADLDGADTAGVRPGEPDGHGQVSPSVLKGAAFLVAAFLANTAQSAFARAVGQGMDALLFTWMTFILALILLVPVLVLRRGRDLPTGVLPLHLLRGGMGMLGFLHLALEGGAGPGRGVRWHGDCGSAQCGHS